MLTFEVELLHGTVRAAAEDDSLTGQPGAGEWPPSPGRLFSALVAADGTRDRCRVTDGSELAYLEVLPPPLIYADSDDAAVASPVQDRYVVMNDTARSTVQNYPARTSSPARPGTRWAPRHPHMAYVWPDAEPSEYTLAALQRRAARVGYLGCADSPVRVRVHRAAPGSQVPEGAWEPAPEADAAGVSLSVPFEGLTDVLDHAFDEFAGGGHQRRSWYRIEKARYRAPTGPRVEPFRVGGTFIWLQFDRSITGRRVASVASTLRAAILDLYQRQLGAGVELPSSLTGHGFTGRGYGHAHWLPLPDVRAPHSKNAQHARGRIHGAAIWLPEGTEPDVVAGVDAAARSLRELVQPDVFSVQVSAAAGDIQQSSVRRLPEAARPHRWQRPSTHFMSAFPVVHERFVRGGPSLDEVTRWCTHAGLPEPAGVALHRYPSLAGGVSLHPREVFRPKDERRPYSHLTIWFDQPVAGPVVLGRRRQFGLGLCAPVYPRLEPGSAPAADTDVDEDAHQDAHEEGHSDG